MVDQPTKGNLLCESAVRWQSGCQCCLELLSETYSNLERERLREGHKETEIERERHRLIERDRETEIERETQRETEIDTKRETAIHLIIHFKHCFFLVAWMVYLCEVFYHFPPIVPM